MKAIEAHKLEAELWCNTENIYAIINDRIAGTIDTVEQWRKGTLVQAEAVDWIFSDFREGKRQLRKASFKRDGSYKVYSSAYTECVNILDAVFMEALETVGFGRL